jgi:hypothetical protein
VAGEALDEIAEPHLDLLCVGVCRSLTRIGEIQRCPK